MAEIETKDIDIEDYAFTPKEIEENGQKILDYTDVENDKVYLANKKDILTKARPAWLPEFDIEGLKKDSFLPVTVHDDKGNYYVQVNFKTGTHTETRVNRFTMNSREVEVNDYEQKIYKMNLDVLAASVDYYLKWERENLKAQGSSQKVSLPRALNNMSHNRYDGMRQLLQFCDNYKSEDKVVFKEYKYHQPTSHTPEAYNRQSHIIFMEQYTPLLQNLKDKKLDLNLQKQDYIDTHAKGEETSYGEKGSIDTLLADYGVKIKKQNGKSLSSSEIESIKNTVEKVWNHYGDFSDEAKKFNMVLSYADNCNQHARKAVGLFNPYYKAIGVSFFTDGKNERVASPDVIFSHEVAHWFDSLKGKETHNWYASDKDGTLENKIALKYKETLRKIVRASKEKLGEYWYRTCECFARSMEQDYAIKHGIKIDELGYLPEDVYKKVIQPMVQELLEENRKYFNLSVWDVKQNVDEKNVESPENIATNYVLEKLKAAGIEVITDKEEFDRILQREEILQKMQGTLSDEEQKRYFTFNEEDTQNRTILIPLAVNKRKGRIVINEITSMYGRNNEVDFVKTNIDEGNLIYLDKKRSLEWERECKVQFLTQGLSQQGLLNSFDGELESRIQFPRQQDTYTETYNPNILTKERLVNFISADSRSNPIQKMTETKKEKAPAEVVTLYMRVSKSASAYEDNILLKSNFVNNLDLFLYAQKGETYGFTFENKIYLNPEIMNSNVAVHEYSHLWDEYTKRTNPELWNKGKNILKNTYLWNEIKSSPDYADISDNDDLLTSEVHSRICGKIAQSVLERIAKENGEITKDTVIDWENEVETFIFKNFSEEEVINIYKINDSSDVRKFFAKPMKDLINGKNISVEKKQEVQVDNSVIQENLSNKSEENIDMERYTKQGMIDSFIETCASWNLRQKEDVYKSYNRLRNEWEEEINHLEEKGAIKEKQYESLMKEGLPCKEKDFPMFKAKIEAKMLEIKEFDKKYNQQSVSNEKSDITYFVKSTAEFDMFADFEPVTGLTADEAVKKYAELQQKNVACGIGINIKGDSVFNDPDAEGITVLVRSNGKDTFNVYGDTFVKQLKENNEHSQNVLTAFEELDSAARKAGLSVEDAPYIAEKRKELFETKAENSLDKVASVKNIGEKLSTVTQSDLIQNFTASQANSLSEEKYGFYFEYNNDENCADIFSSKDGDFVGSIGEGGFGYADDLSGNDPTTKIPENDFRSVIELAQRYYDESRREFENSLERGEEKSYSWNEIYENAIGKGNGDVENVVYNTAREKITEYAKQYGVDVENDDGVSPEDIIDSFVEEHKEISFAKDGNIIIDEQKRAIVSETNIQGSSVSSLSDKNNNHFDIYSEEFISKFGDWEKANRLEKVKNSEPISITGNERCSPGIIRGEYFNSDSNRDILLPFGDKDPIRAFSAALPQIIEKSIYVSSQHNEDVQKHPNLKSYDYYLCGLKIAGEDYIVKNVITNTVDGWVVYNHELSGIEKGKLAEIITQRMSRENSEVSLAKKYDKRLIQICQVPQMPYLEKKYGEWQPTVETAKKVMNGTLFVEKDKNGVQILHDTEKGIVIGQELSNFFKNASQNEELSMKEKQSTFDNEIDDLIAGKLEYGHIFNLGKPGEILQKCGFPDNQRIELAEARLRMKATQGNHPFDLKDVKGLDKALQEPVGVFEYGNKEKSQNVIVNLQKDGKNFLVGVFFNQKQRGYEVSDIRGLFNRDNIDWIRWIQQGKMIYGNKEKIQVLITQQRTNLAEVNNKEVRTSSDSYYLDSTENIMQNFGDVNDVFTSEFPKYAEQKERYKIYRAFNQIYQNLESVEREDAVMQADEFYDALVNNDTKKIELYESGLLYNDIADKAKEIHKEFEMEKGKSMQRENIVTQSMKEENPKVWKWVDYEDGSGSLHNPEGKEVAEYDLTTHEFKVNDGWEQAYSYAGNKSSPWTVAEIKAHVEQTLGITDKIIVHEKQPGIEEEQIVEEKIQKLSSMPLNFEPVNKDKDVLPFDLIENKEKGRVNIKFNPAQKNPYFNDIIKELKSNGWKYAPSSRQWYPLEVSGSKNFALNLQKKYSEKLNDVSVQDELNDFILPSEVNKITNLESTNPNPNVENTEIDKIRYFDLNYQENKEFAEYFNKNLNLLKKDVVKISEKDAGSILKALNHLEGGFVENRNNRLGLDENKNLVIVTRKDGNKNIRKTNLNELLLIAKEMSEKELLDSKKCLEKYQNGDSTLDKSLTGIFENLYETCVEQSIEIKNSMQKIFDNYYKTPESISVNPLQEGETIGKDTVMNVYPIAEGVYQATLGQNSGNGVTSAASFFVVDESIASNLRPELLGLMEKYDNRYVVESKYNEPYVLKELIDKNIIPPRDAEYVQKLDDFIVSHPEKYAKLYPVNSHNFADSLRKLAVIDKDQHKNSFTLGKQLLSMVEDSDKKNVSDWIIKQGGNTEENMKKLFSSWITGKEINRNMENSIFNQKNNGYPPRGE